MPENTPSTPRTAMPTPAPAAEMVTLTLHVQPENQLAVAMPAAEWKGLVENFARMPVIERTQMGHSIRNAVATNPFPENMPTSPHQLSAAQQQACDTFVTDCMLLAALAEATNQRVLAETALHGYHLSRGNTVKHRLN